MIAGVGFWIGGVHGMFLGTGSGAGLALIAAALLTSLQGTGICPGGLKLSEVDAAGLSSLPAFINRFCCNFSVSFFVLPFLILDGL